MTAVERRVGVLKDDLQRRGDQPANASGSVGGKRRTVERRRVPASARRSRAACGRVSSSRCPTRRRGRASRRARSPPSRRRARGRRVPRWWKTFAEVVEPHERRRCVVDRRVAGSRGLHSRGSSCALSWYQQRLTWPTPTASSDGSSVWQRSSARAQRSANTQPGEIRSETRQEARNRVEAAVVLPNAAARNAA